MTLWLYDSVNEKSNENILMSLHDMFLLTVSRKITYTSFSGYCKLYRRLVMTQVCKREIHVEVCVTFSLLFLTWAVSLLYINRDVSSSCSLSALGHLWVPFSILKLIDSQVSLPFHTWNCCPWYEENILQK